MADIIDRSRNNTGYWERSNARYKQDYANAIKLLGTWINEGSDWEKRPLFKEPREGHRHAMDHLGLLNKRHKDGKIMELDSFLRTKERRRERWRNNYHSLYSEDEAKKQQIERLLDVSIQAKVCFGCGEVIQGKYLNPDPPAPKLKVHPNKECQKQAAGKYRMIDGQK